MKINPLNTSIIAITATLFLYSCDQTKNANVEKKETANETVKNNFKLNKEPDTMEFKTIYNDGRITAVRNQKYYNYLLQDAKVNGDTVLKLSTVVSEWNRYDANIAGNGGGFIQVPRTAQEVINLKKELKASGADTTEDLNSTMVGGDVESNRRFTEPSKRFFAVAKQIFEQEFKNLKKAEGISNRDTNYVTFDFITNIGLYTVQEQKNILESNQSVWSNLFTETKFLNTEMARVQNESQQYWEEKLRKKTRKKAKA